MKSRITSIIKKCFRFRYPVSLIEPAYFWIRGPKLLKWFFAFRPISLAVFEIKFLRNIFFSISVNERIVENTFALSLIPKSKTRIFDFGTTSSWLSLQLASLGHEVTGLDLRPYEFSHPNINFIQNDLFKSDLPQNYFDFVLIISTLEHVRVSDDSADSKAMKILSNSLKKGGKIILTVPYGKPVITLSHRVYSRERIDKIIPGGVVKKDSLYFKKNSPMAWIKTEENEAANMDSSKTSNGLCCLLLEKI